MKRPPRHRARGFTLIEALAAIGVLVIVMPVLLQGFTIAGNIAMDARQYAEATALAQSKLDELLATRDWMAGAMSGDDVTLERTTYSWQSALGNYDADVNVQTLTVTVQWRKRAESHQVELATVVFIPGSTVQSQATSLGGVAP